VSDRVSACQQHGKKLPKQHLTTAKKEKIVRGNLTLQTTFYFF
jgi:hypothetical protein